MLLFNVVMYLLAVCLNKHQVVFYVQIKCNTVIHMNYNFQGALLYFGFSEVQKFPKILKKFQKDFNKNWPLLPWKCKVENSKLLSTFMFVLLLTMTCNQWNGIQILYNIYVSVCNKYLINVVVGVNC